MGTISSHSCADGSLNHKRRKGPAVFDASLAARLDYVESQKQQKERVLNSILQQNKRFGPRTGQFTTQSAKGIPLPQGEQQSYSPQVKTSAVTNDCRGASSRNYPHPLSVEDVCKDGTPPPPLQLTDRVVFVKDNVPEFGEVKWLGKLPDVDKGWIAGVEFDNPIGAGTGKYNDYRLFTAKMNHASLLPIVGLMKADAFLSDCRGASRNYPHPLSVEDVCKDGTPPPPLQLMQRVVFLRDNCPEFGQVKWLGKLPDVDRGWIAGVEFDNPIGAGTGKYNDYRLFTAKMNHALLLPIVSLMKTEAFLMECRGASRNYPHPLSVEDVCKDGTPPPPLQLMERVVFVRDNGPEFGQVKWLGKLPDVERGWIAGVEFDNPIGVGTGKYIDYSLFTAKMNHALLLPIVSLMKTDAFLMDCFGASSRNYNHPLSVEDVCKDGTPHPPLQLMERVVFVRDNGPEFGQVKWLGKLPDVDRGWIAGVEYDNPIGAGTGKYNDYQLFTAKMNHASFLPIAGLIKADAFLRGSSELLETKKSDDDSNISKNGFDCPVCLVPVTELRSSETVIISTVCGHIFCEPCIDKILESNNECPNCRTKIFKLQNRKLYF